jgi:CRP/FNR family cyclic AMP-dependent transcriptional regulator
MLDGTRLFANVSQDTIDLLNARARSRKLAKGELLFSPGDEPNGIYVVKSGRIRIWTVSASGVEITLNVLGEGAIFGEIALLDGSARTAGASARDKAELLAIGPSAFDEALDRDSTLAKNTIAILCERLRWVSARMEDAALRNAAERLARLLVHLCDDHGVASDEGVELSLNLSQGELAQWAQMSRENLNKIINRWASEGLLSHSRGSLTVRDYDRLLDIAEIGDDA